MQKSEHFQEKINAPVWRDLIRLSSELDGFPKYMGSIPAA